MTLAFAALVMILAFGIIGWPLLRTSRRPLTPEQSQPAALDRLIEQRNQIYADLRDLEFDRGVGTLGDDDYAELQHRYKRQAIAVLKEMARFGVGPVAAVGKPTDADLDAEIERAIRARRRVQPALPVSTNGTAPAVSAPGSVQPAARRWAAGMSLVAAMVLVGVGALYWFNRPAANVQQPIASIDVATAGPMAVLPDGRALLASSQGVLMTTDGGQSWRATGPVGSVRALTVAGTTAYAIAGEQLIRSQDAGATWSPLETTLPVRQVRALAAVPDSPALLYAMVADQGLLASHDGGATWLLLGAGIPADTVELAILPGQPPVLYAASLSKNVVRSVNDGRTWEPASGAANLAIQGQVRRLAIASRSGLLLAGTDRGLFRSETGGADWLPLLYRGDVSAIGIDPRQPDRVFIVDGRGQVFRSDDRGQTWRGQE